jgi:hypothetical protein
VSGALSTTTCGACGKPVAYVNVNPTDGPPVYQLKSAYNLAGPAHRDNCWPVPEVTA